MTDNHNYKEPEPGQDDWHVPINENFDNLDKDVEIRDAEETKSEYSPKVGAKFFATDTENIYIGDGNKWHRLASSGKNPALSSVSADNINGEAWIDPADGIAGINAAVENNATIHLKPGTYSGEKLIIDKNDVTIVGRGSNTTLKNTHGGNVIEFEDNDTGTGADATVLKRFGIDGNKSNQGTGNGIVTSDHVRGFRFEDLNIRDTPEDGIQLLGSYEGRLDGVEVENCSRNGFYVEDSSGVDTSALTFTDCRSDGVANDGVHLRQAWEVRFFGGEWGGNRGIAVHEDCFNIYIHGGDFEGYDSVGLQMGLGGNGLIDSSSVYGCRFKGDFQNPQASEGILLKSVDNLTLIGVRTDGHSDVGLKSDDIWFHAAVFEMGNNFQDGTSRKGPKQHTGFSSDPSDGPDLNARGSCVRIDNPRRLEPSGDDMRLINNSGERNLLDIKSNGKFEFKAGGNVQINSGGLEVKVQDLSGIAGSTTGEVRTDDGTNTPSGDPELCVWTGNEWRPMSGASEGKDNFS